MRVYVARFDCFDRATIYVLNEPSVLARLLKFLDARRGQSLTPCDRVSARVSNFVSRWYFTGEVWVIFRPSPKNRHFYFRRNASGIDSRGNFDRLVNRNSARRCWSTNIEIRRLRYYRRCICVYGSLASLLIIPFQFNRCPFCTRMLFWDFN